MSCEGYESPDDPFILKGAWRTRNPEEATHEQASCSIVSTTGSCGLTYNLVRVDPSLESESYPGARSSRNYASQFSTYLKTLYWHHNFCYYKWLFDLTGVSFDSKLQLASSSATSSTLSP